MFVLTRKCSLDMEVLIRLNTPFAERRLNTTVKRTATVTTNVIRVISQPGIPFFFLGVFRVCTFTLALFALILFDFPIAGSTFAFYFDLESSVYSPRLAALLAELERECDEFSYLGSYSEVI